MTYDLDAGRALFPDGNSVRAYADPVEIISATSLNEVQPALDALEAHVARGFHVAGYLAYEAAGAFDSALQTHGPGPLPLLWFGVYETVQLRPQPAPCQARCPEMHWRHGTTKTDYVSALARIRDHIAAGDSYQVNYTFPMEADFHSAPETWFWERLAAQESRYGAFLDLGRHKVMSLSPELFFKLDGEALFTRPMKGTRPRGFSTIDDDALAADLAQSPKDRAENLMIVDMLRNDLGRVCAINSIQVPALFSVERYPTVWQMTSTITGKTAASVPAIFAALFPSGSVTGAPKIETMKIIRDLEPGPRGVYCGAIGWWAPERQAQFNVAIRTATLDMETGVARYPAGSGITWDSDPDGEYEECLQKSAVLRHIRPAFSIISALRLDDQGLHHIEAHLDRLADSASYFGYAFARDAVRDALESYVENVAERPAKVRVAVERNGEIKLTNDPLQAPRPWRIGLAEHPVDPHQPWLHHKTTHRTVYDEAQASRPDCDAVLLWTPEGQLTEATTANLVVRKGACRLTPPAHAGLLNGVFRRCLLEAGEIQESALWLDDLAGADEILLINSVRGWIKTAWVPHDNDPDSLKNIR